MVVAVNGRMSERERSQRLTGAEVALAVLFGGLTVAFFSIQIGETGEFSVLASENRVRAVAIPAARGLLLDRHGRVMADNTPTYVISSQPGPLQEFSQALGQLREPLGLSEARVAALVRERADRPFQVIVVLAGATFEQMAHIEERRPRFPNLRVDLLHRRTYPLGAAAAHVVGYLGEITEEELADPAFAGYVPGQLLGRNGLEARYERRLVGRDGVRYVEVNTLGAVVRELPGTVEAMPGQDLHLSIDMDLQQLAHSAFPRDYAGGVVALDPRTGEVLVSYSSPTFDTNLMVGGVPQDIWDGLLQDSQRPLLDRVVAGAYPPGSTFKPIVAAIAMRAGAADPGTEFDHACAGGLPLGNRYFRCWDSSGHGRMNLVSALVESCNVYFYQLGQALGLEALLQGAAGLALNGVTGVDLPFEQPGNFPLSTAEFDQMYGERGWNPTVAEWNLSIGQGENTQSVLSMAQLYASLATGRPAPEPRLTRLAGAGDPPRTSGRDLGLIPEQRAALIGALVDAVNHPDGTAYEHRLDRWEMAGKTGTAQNPAGEPHSWFVGFAPARDPKIVVAAVVEHGHPEGETHLSVPLAARIVEEYLTSMEQMAAR